MRTEQDILDEGGCRVRGIVHENGAVWNPSVLPYGEINCVTCKCKVLYQFMFTFVYIQSTKSKIFVPKVIIFAYLLSGWKK